MDDQQREVVAWSLDGRTIDLRGPADAGLRPGAYVAIGADDDPILAQVLSLRRTEVDGQHGVEATGRVVAPARDAAPFGDRPATPAPDALLERRLAPRATALHLGALRDAPSVPARLAATGFDRHTFVCGQSGSGKTYTLGRLLEELVLRTSLPLLVLDPNGDHVHLGSTRPDVDPAAADAYTTAASGVVALRAAPTGHEPPLRIRLRELGTAAAAALLQLDPVADREEYNGLVHALADAPADGFASVDDALAAFHASGERVLDLLRMRAENLGVDRMRAWSATAARTIGDVLDEDHPRVVVADTSGFDERRERLAVTLAVLERLWARRTERRPVLLVVDEAHDVCPADPADPLERLAVDRFTRLAGEGRKYGLYLLLASQRPDKLPENVLSQCDNLVLLRVNSAADRHTLAARFGFVPPELVDLSGGFGLGEALVAGRCSPDPQLLRTGARLTPEGGADVPTDWASPTP